MKFKVLAEDELNNQRFFLEEGICDFEVLEANERNSKAGNPMIELKLKCTDKNGKVGIIFDYIVSVNMEWKIKSFCESINHPEYYQQGEIDSKYVEGKMGRVEVYLQKEHIDKNGTLQKAAMRARTYIPADDLVVSNNKSKPVTNDDDVPF